MEVARRQKAEAASSSSCWTFTLERSSLGVSSLKLGVCVKLLTPKVILKTMNHRTRNNKYNFLVHYSDLLLSVITDLVLFLTTFVQDER